MTIYEILSFNKELLQRLFNAGIRTSDCLYVDLFDDYTRMRAAGEKTTYIVAVLSDKYALSERKVYGIIRYLSKRLHGPCSARSGVNSLIWLFGPTFVAKP